MWMRHWLNYYMYTFIVIFCTMSIIYLIVSRKYRKSVGRLSCFAGMSVLLALWFGLGDGAPVNDRYALIVLVTWGMMWMLVLLRILPRRKGKLCGRKLKFIVNIGSLG